MSQGATPKSNAEEPRRSGAGGKGKDGRKLTDEAPHDENTDERDSRSTSSNRLSDGSDDWGRRESAPSLDLDSTLHKYKPDCPVPEQR